MCILYTYITCFILYKPIFLAYYKKVIKQNTSHQVHDDLISKDRDLNILCLHVIK